MEDDVLKFWEEQKIFEKSVSKKAPNGDYVFYDGPPFATGTPHYGHIVGSVMKDVVPRYWTMKGFRVERKWGWDCHGLPIENIVEKEMGSKTKKEIEELGVEKFNNLCRSKVLQYVSEWERVIKRLGRWADMKNAYKTMNLSFMESVWWVFKELYDRGLVYESYRSMHICPRCETTLSQSEVAEGYKIIKDLSCIVKFELADESGTFILAWTTTPWTLIGNVALAVGENIDYVKVETRLIASLRGVTEIYILAKERLADIMKEKEYKIISEFKGVDLIGKKYKPVFDYYSKQENLENKERGWKIYAADFVTTEEGTGVVHIAPAFGDDDFKLSQQYKLPFIQHVGMDGIVKKEAGEFSGVDLKPRAKNKPEEIREADLTVVKFLEKQGKIFSSEKYEHSYPHCWRCDTPLINYATSSWFVAVTKIKERALELAKNINWTPAHIKEGRFGNWLEGARDWSISRQRFWASVIPIWKCEKCNELKVVGSVDEIKEGFGNPNLLYLVRHGQADNNVKGIIVSHPKEGENPLTEKGRNQIEESAKFLKDKKVDIIFSSPIQRTMETAEIISKKVGAEVVVDERLAEVELGKLEGKSWEEYLNLYPKSLNPERTDKIGIEGLEDIRDRLDSFIEDMNEKYKGKNIAIVSHGNPLRVMNGILLNMSKEGIMDDSMPKNGQIIKSYSKPVDLHKHIVDKITFKCKECGGTMKRIPDVLDTWFDSGSMPYAQMHYPFENKEKFEANFPAEFIAEGQDQCRCWFYYLHTISTAIKDSHAFKNVIVNGIVVGEDGKKLSKRLKNYPDPSAMFEKYGADSLRFYLMSSPVVAAENLNFKEADVADITRGMMRMLWNSYSFFVLYANIDKFKVKSEKFKVDEINNLLDKWIISELNVLIKEVNGAMEKYEINHACRLFPKFIDNLSNWYIRRSRKRFWKSEDDGDKNSAYQSLHYILIELSKLMAPFTPFIAEEIYCNLMGGVETQNFASVHLANFPAADEKLIDEKLNDEMESARNIITEALQLRAKAGIKVRQPLPDLRFKNYDLRKEFLDIIREEVNVKEVIFDEDILENIILNTEITEELKLEGQAREIIRFIQEMRKEAGFEVDDRIIVGYDGMEEVFGDENLKSLIAKEVLAVEIKKEKPENFDLQKTLQIDDKKIIFWIKRK